MKRDTRKRDRRGRSGSRNSFGGGFNNSFMSRGGGGFNRGPPREMHKATCADCKAECEVPFKPTEGRPVYCRECFSKQRDRR